ncbi:MAG: hypothetical protein BAJALOKI1v1_60003 [Promethearchaeota archaeon]|nr:MAG: hypothetical protein BAJALOKI1v1_60003 [Candidatus Lokiarchaeota archaeon]
MYKIYIREQGKKKEFLIQKGGLIDTLINEFQFTFDFEINLCHFGILGEELYKDTRLKEKLRYEDKERFNRIVAGKTFRDLRICYVCWLNDLTLFIQGLLHEINHFRDPFETKPDHIQSLGEEGVYIDTNKYIKNLLETHLNDFFAEYNAINKLIQLYLKGYRKINLYILAKNSLDYLGEDDKYKTKIREILEENIPSFEKQMKIIYFIQHFLFKYIFYFLAGYRAFQDNRFKSIIFEKRWNAYLMKIPNSPMRELLIQIKNKVLDRQFRVIENISELKNYTYDTIRSFYYSNFFTYIAETLELEQSIVNLSFRRIKKPYSIFEIMNQIEDFYRPFETNWVESLNINSPIFKIAEQMDAYNILFNMRWLKIFNMIQEPFESINKMVKMYDSLGKLFSSF